EPDGPMTATYSPCSIRRSTPRRASNSMLPVVYVLVTPTRSMTVPVRVSTSGAASSAIGPTALQLARVEARRGAALGEGALLLPTGAAGPRRERGEHDLVALGQPLRDLRDVPGGLADRDGHVEGDAVGADPLHGGRPVRGGGD